MHNPVIIFGANPTGKVALATLQSNDILTYCFLDDNESLLNTEIDNVSVLGKFEDDDFLKLIGKKCDAFVASDDNKIRKYLTEKLKTRYGIECENVLDKTAYFAKSATMAKGVLVQASAVISAGVAIGNAAIIGAGAIIEVNAEIGEYVQIGAGAIIGAGAKIEDGAFIGAGAIVISSLNIGKGARVGAGSVVIKNVEKGKTVFGNPAEELKAKV